METSLRIKKMSPQLLVVDIERAIDFYTKTIGFELDFRYEDFYAGIIKKEFSIHLKVGNPSISKRVVSEQIQNLDITFSIDEIDHWYQTLSATSVEIIQPLRQMPYGKEFYIADPDGNVIAFLEES